MIGGQINMDFVHDYLSARGFSLLDERADGVCEYGDDVTHLGIIPVPFTPLRPGEAIKVGDKALETSWEFWNLNTPPIVLMRRAKGSGFMRHQGKYVDSKETNKLNTEKRHGTFFASPLELGLARRNGLPKFQHRLQHIHDTKRMVQLSYVQEPTALLPESIRMYSIYEINPLASRSLLVPFEQVRYFRNEIHPNIFERWERSNDEGSMTRLSHVNAAVSYWNKGEQVEAPNRMFTITNNLFTGQ